jgi:hypothetical protein
MKKCYLESRSRRNKRRRASCIGHILRRNCLLKHAIEGKVEVTGRRGRRRKHLLEELEEMRGYCKLREEARCGELALEEVMDLS